jgi:transcriptional regulator with XRE-family HTH domain
MSATDPSYFFIHTERFLDKCRPNCSIEFNMRRSLGKTIHDARRAQKKTLRTVALDLGISASLLSLIEQDKHVPPKQLIAKLADYLRGEADLWCALAGQLSPETEASFAKIARDDPIFFRQMLNRR